MKKIGEAYFVTDEMKEMLQNDIDLMSIPEKIWRLAQLSLFHLWCDDIKEYLNEDCCEKKRMWEFAQTNDFDLWYEKFKDYLNVKYEMNNKYEIN